MLTTPSGLRSRASRPRSAAPFDGPNNTRRQQLRFNRLSTYAAAGLRPRLEAGVVCCVLSRVDGRLKVRQSEGGPHARATFPTNDASATTSGGERRGVARLRAVRRHMMGHNTRRQPPHATAVLRSAFRFVNRAILGFSISLPSQCSRITTHYTLSPAHRPTIRAEVLTAASHIEDLPPTVREAMRTLFKERALSLANPGESFQANPWQMVLAPHAPSRRLINAACGPDHCLVHYEEGRFQHSFRVLVFGLNRHDAQLEWAGTSSRALADVEAIKTFTLRQ